jgi:hypothetical protein
MRAYHDVPDAFRRWALTTFGSGVAAIVASSPSLRLMPVPPRPVESCADDEEFAQSTIFPFTIVRDGRPLSPDECKKIYRALAQDSQGATSAGEHNDALAAKACLIGQPVALGRGGHAGAVLRICAGARLVSDAWSPDRNIANFNLQRELDNVRTVVLKIEWLLTHMDDSGVTEMRREA